MSNYIALNHNRERIDKYEKRMSKAISLRALIVVLFGTFAGMLLGNVVIGIAVAVTFIAVWIVVRAYRETNYILENPRG